MWVCRLVPHELLTLPRTMHSDSFISCEADPMFTAGLSTALQLLALVFYCSKVDILGPTSYSLLRELVRYPKFHSLRSRVKQQLFVCLACIRGNQSSDSYSYQNTWDERSLFKFGINSDEMSPVSETDCQLPPTLLLFDCCQELATVAAFASYVCFVSKISFSDSLVVVETWIYFRDLLSLSLQHRGSLRAMKGVAIDMIVLLCYAMSRLIHLMDNLTRMPHLLFLWYIWSVDITGTACLFSPLMVDLNELLKRQASEIAACQMLNQIVRFVSCYIGVMYSCVCRYWKAWIILLPNCLSFSCR